MDRSEEVDDSQGKPLEQRHDEIEYKREQISDRQIIRRRLTMSTQETGDIHGPYRDPFATDSLTPMAGSVQGDTSRELGWGRATILPRELTTPDHNSQQCVPLYGGMHDTIWTETADTKKGDTTNTRECA